MLEIPSFNKTLPTVIYIHGYLASGKNDPSAVAIRSAYLDRGDHNVITFSWLFYSINYYHFVVPQLKVVSGYRSLRMEITKLKFKRSQIRLLSTWCLSSTRAMTWKCCTWSVIHSGKRFLDFSVNFADSQIYFRRAHTAGRIGRVLKEKSGGRYVISKIIGLDPAGKGFYPPLFNFDHISANDAEFVQVIHTNTASLGTKQRSGTVDIYPNGGDTQPGCDMSYTEQVVKPLQDACSHSRAWQLYQESVRNPEAFPAIKCDSWGEFLLERNCDDEDNIYMGFGANTSGYGKYYLKTNANVFHLSKSYEGTYDSHTNVTYPFGEPWKVFELLMFWKQFDVSRVQKWILWIKLSQQK